MDMREQVVKFEKFIQENDAKRVRAEAKAKQVFRRWHTSYLSPSPTTNACQKGLQCVVNINITARLDTSDCTASTKQLRTY